MLQTLPAFPELAVTQPTAEITAKFQVYFQADGVGELELILSAATLLRQMRENVTALTDADLQAIVELFDAATDVAVQRTLARP